MSLAMACRSPRKAARLRHADRGQCMTEYGIVIAVIVLLILGRGSV